MSSDKLHVTCRKSFAAEKLLIPRKYTLTHSDSTGDLFLTIDCEYNEKQISHFYTRFMRDEVLAEWIDSEGVKELHVYLHVSGGFIFGWPKLRYKIFKNFLPFVIRTLKEGDNQLFDAYPELLKVPILVHFISKRKEYNKIELYGLLQDF